MSGAILEARIAALRAAEAALFDALVDEVTAAQRSAGDARRAIGEVVATALDGDVAAARAEVVRLAGPTLMRADLLAAAAELTSLAARFDGSPTAMAKARALLDAIESAKGN